MSTPTTAELHAMIQRLTEERELSQSEEALR